MSGSPPDGSGPPPGGCGPPPDGSRPPPDGSGPPKDGSGPPKDGSGPPKGGCGPPPLSYDHVQAGLKVCREEGIDCDGAVMPADGCERQKPPKMPELPILDDDPVMYFRLGCYCCEEGEEQAPSLSPTLAPQDEVVPALTRHAFGPSNGGAPTAKEVICEKSNIECGEFFSTINQNCSVITESFKPLDDLIAEEDENRGNLACHCCQVHDSDNIFSNEEHPRGGKCDFEKIDCPQIFQEYDCTRRDFLGLEPVFGFGFGKNSTVDADRLVCGCCFNDGSTLEEVAVQLAGDSDSAATLSSTNPLAVLGSVMIFLKFMLY